MFLPFCELALQFVSAYQTLDTTFIYGFIINSIRDTYPASLLYLII